MRLTSINVRDLRPGDHVAVRRAGYTHHGVCAGGDRVIHFSDENGIANKLSAKVIETPLDGFLQGGGLLRAFHRRTSPPAVVIQRAEAVMRGDRRWRPYSLVSNNCEHFATYCVTGRKFSLQVQRVAAAAAGGLVAAGGIISAARRRRRA